MLPASNRLRSQDDYKRVYRAGKYFSLRGITVNVCKNDLNTTRFGFIVGKSYSKTAVDRNKAKRRLRAISSKMMPQIKYGYDIVINFKPRELLGFKEIQEIIINLFSKAKLIK